MVMCFSSRGRYVSYRNTLASLIAARELPFSKKLLEKLTPQWTDTYRQSIDKKLLRGPVREVTPPTLIPGTHSIEITTSKIFYREFELLGNVPEANVASANDFAERSWKEYMIYGKPAEIVEFVVIPPGYSHSNLDLTLPVMFALSLPLAEIQTQAWQEHTHFRACLNQHIMRYTACVAGTRELRAAAGNARIETIEICCGCGRQYDFCHCFKPSVIDLSSLVALPVQVMERLALRVQAKFIAANRASK